MNKTVKRLVIFLAVVLLIGLAGMAVVKTMEAGLANLLTVDIQDPDMSSIEDGTYFGEYSQAPISVHVEVTVLNHQITEIVITEHITGQGLPAEEIVSDVISTQSLQVDTVAGATYSSKCILLAIQDALSPDVE
ncbi:MAG: FMN-binding protein [Candidatus Izemoplasmatales bacterium]